MAPRTVAPALARAPTSPFEGVGSSDGREENTDFQMTKEGALHLADGYLVLADPSPRRHQDLPTRRPRERLPGGNSEWRHCCRSTTWWIGPRIRCLKIAFSSAVFCLSVSFIPIYNKKVFAGGSGIHRFPYPLTIGFLQLSLVSVCLGIASLGQHFLQPPPRWGDGAPLQRSWLFGPLFWYKVCHAAPAGLCFGLKYAVTNWGLQLVPLGTHLLLQATDLLWTVGLARLINGEQLTLQEVVCAVLASTGTVLISVDASEDLGAPLIPILVNLLTPLFLGLSVTTLRWAVQELMRPTGPLGGTMTVMELTSMKLAISALTCLACASVLESGGIGLSKHTGVHVTHKPPWWEALAQYPPQGTMLILAGGLLVLVFQVNITWLIRMTSAVTVGMVGSVKVVPQWLLNRTFGLGRSLTPMSALGTLLVLLSSFLYFHLQLLRSRKGAAAPLPLHVGALREGLLCCSGGDPPDAMRSPQPSERSGRCQSA